MKKKKGMQSTNTGSISSILKVKIYMHTSAGYQTQNIS